jgi:hypothetical protein
MITVAGGLITVSMAIGTSIVSQIVIQKDTFTLLSLLEHRGSGLGSNKYLAVYTFLFNKRL